MVASKECQRCHIIKPLEDFHVKRANKDGHDSYCKKCNNEKAQYYRKNFPERTKEIAAKTRAKNREKIRERNREFYARTKNDPEHIEARKRYYERGKDKWLEAEREKRRRLNERWRKPCAKCGESRLYLIHFHHIDPKTKEFCIGADIAWRKEEILEKEIEKCVCLCSNCHDEFHYLYGARPEHPVENLKEYLTNNKGEQL